MPELDAILADIAGITARRAQRDRRDQIPIGPALVVGCARRAGSPASVLWLDNKGAGLDCVTRLAVGLTDDDLAAWRAANPGPADPQAVLDRTTLLVEDASADSIMGTLLLLLRLAGTGLGDRLPEWLTSVALWETAGVAAGDPWSEWPVLVSALTHAQYSVGAYPTDAEYAAAWTKGLRFAAECLRSDRAPTDLAALPGSALHQEARAALRRHDLLDELKACRKPVAHATETQADVSKAAAIGAHMIEAGEDAFFRYFLALFLARTPK